MYNRGIEIVINFYSTLIFEYLTKERETFINYFDSKL